MLSIIVPVYNEAASLWRLYDELHWATAYLEVGSGRLEVGRSGVVASVQPPTANLQPPTSEFIFVDDGSTDGSWDILGDIAMRDPRVTAVRLRRNFGKATAYAAGLAHAHGDIIATMDADLQDDPGELARLIAVLTGRVRIANGSESYESCEVYDHFVHPSYDGAPYSKDSHDSRNSLFGPSDMVVGWKEYRHDTRLKIITSHWYNALLRRVAGTTLHDHNSGFRVMRREVAEALPLRGDLHRVIPAVAAMQGFRVAEVPVRHRARPYGTSKYGRTGLRRAFHGIADLATVAFLMRYRSRPFHFFGGWGLTLLSVGIVLNAYLTVLWFGGASIGRRPLLLLGILCVVVGVQLIATGFLADLLISRGPREEPPVAEVIRVYPEGAKRPKDLTT